MKTNALSHNIFQYATKELSQDAFIAWLLSYACSDGKEKDYGLWSCAQSFLRSFVGKEDDSTFTVTNILKQMDNIDVYVEMHDQKSIDKKYAVIIEDKVNSALHDDQISKYIGEVRKKLESSNREIYVVYFKTGHIEDAEDIEIRRTAEKYKWIHPIAKIDLTKIATLLNSTTSASEIFESYKEYIQHLKEMRESVKETVTRDGFYHKEDDRNPLYKPYGQWCFLETIFPVRTKDDNEEMLKSFETWMQKHPNYRSEQPPCVKDFMYSGSSSGTPWTQYCFWEMAHDKVDIADENRPKHHSLFWRLDPGQISLRYYVNCGLSNPQEDKHLKDYWKDVEELNVPGIDSWKKVTKVRNNAKYEFALLEHKFSPEDKFEDLRAQILEIHHFFQNVK